MNDIPSLGPTRILTNLSQNRAWRGDPTEWASEDQIIRAVLGIEDDAVQELQECEKNEPAVPLISLSQLDDWHLLRVSEVAAYLGISDAGVRRLFDSGALKSRKVGGLRMVMVRDLKDYLDSLN